MTIGRDALDYNLKWRIRTPADSLGLVPALVTEAQLVGYDGTTTKLVRVDTSGRIQTLNAAGSATPQDTTTRPANTTQYTAGDVAFSTVLSVSDATNASPIVITAGTHGLATGDRVTIASVGGNTAANADWTITRVDATTFSLDGSTGNGAYTSGGTVARLGRIAVARVAGQTGIIHSLTVVRDATQATQPQLDLYLWKAQVTLQADNVAWAPTDADMLDMLPGCPIQFITWNVGNGNCSSSQKNLALPFDCGTSDTELFYCYVERGTYTPASGEALTLIAGVTQD